MTGVSTLTDYVQAYEPDIERVLKLGVDGIISDYPERVRAAL